MKRVGGLLVAGGVSVQKSLQSRDVLRGDGAEGPVSVGFHEAVDVVALSAELFAPEVLQGFCLIEVVEGIPVGDGRTVWEKVLQLIQLVPGDGVECDGDIPAAAVGGDLAVVLLSVSAQGEGEGLTQTGIVYLEVKRTLVDGILRVIHIPPDEGGAGGGVADAVGIALEKIPQSGEIFQVQGLEIQHTIFKSFSQFLHSVSERRPKYQPVAPCFLHKKPVFVE